ncbi:MAG: phosphatidate cytidylyltransferase [Planctomycetota bacterium]
MDAHPAPSEAAPAPGASPVPPKADGVHALRVVLGVSILVLAIGLLAVDEITDRPFAFILLTVLAGTFALHEFLGMLPADRVAPFRALALLAGAMVLAASWADTFAKPAASFGREAALAGAFFLLLWRASRMPLERETLEGLALAFFGVFLLGYLVGFLIRIRLCPEGETACWMIIACVKGGDSAAYFAGTLFGRHRMTPRVSPKKTWEGAAGCVLGGMLLAVPFAIFWGWGKAHPIDTLALGAILGAAGQAGDLAESFLKRCLRVKDSGSLFGEAGGFLDLIDSLLVAAPAAYLYLALSPVAWDWTWKI